MNLQTILIPVDGSEPSRKACEYGVELAHKVGASILLLHCHKAVPATLGNPNRQEYLDDLVIEAEQVLAPFVQLLEDSRVEFTTRILGGPTAEVIFDTAKAEHADMIVMGSRGKSDLEGLLVGSVTHRLLHISPCPVLVIR